MAREMGDNKWLDITIKCSDARERRKMEEGKIKMAMIDMWMVESARIKVTDSRIMSKVDIVTKWSECLRSTLP